MKNGRCLKCSGENIYSSYILSGRSGFSFRFFKLSFLTSYICCDCGYLEEYLDASNSKLLEDIEVYRDGIEYFDDIAVLTCKIN